MSEQIEAPEREAVGFDAFLERQTRSIDLPREHLQERRELILSPLTWARLSDRLGAVLLAVTLGVGLIAATAVAWMAWEAREAGGLTIDPFSTLSDLAVVGPAGQTLKSRLLDGV